MESSHRGRRRQGHGGLRRGQSKLALAEGAKEQHDEDEPEDDGQQGQQQLQILEVLGEPISCRGDHSFLHAHVEGQPGDADDVAASLIETNGGGDGAGDGRFLGGGDAVVEDNGDTQLFEATGRLDGACGGTGDLVVGGGFGAGVLAVPAPARAGVVGAIVRAGAGDVANGEV